MWRISEPVRLRVSVRASTRIETPPGAERRMLPAFFGEEGAHRRAGAVAVVGQRLDEDRDAARAVALVHDRLERVGVGALPRAFGDRALDVVLWHRRVLG